jgi:hypothetical protein
MCWDDPLPFNPYISGSQQVPSDPRPMLYLKVRGQWREQPIGHAPSLQLRPSPKR